MNAEFLVGTCFEISGLGLVLAGEVKSGEIAEGSLGRTNKGKKCTVVKIEESNHRVPVAHTKSKVTITVKHITKADVRPWDMIYFE